MAETFQLYYYGRQPALDARYTVDSDTPTEDIEVIRHIEEDDFTEYRYHYQIAKLEELDHFPEVEYDSELDADNVFHTGTAYLIGKRAPNWLRDQNERLILFGALAEAFDYLQETQQAQIYRQKMQAEIAALNQEDKMRLSRGGNVNVHFKGPLL